uniref:(northern house mosquito) hypothetical protein n=1 Tax=Culex pipiens TaxID=7175 RepID=A0A8D8GHA5_CULPI
MRTISAICLARLTSSPRPSKRVAPRNGCARSCVGCGPTLPSVAIRRRKALGWGLLGSSMSRNRVAACRSHRRTLRWWRILSGRGLSFGRISTAGIMDRF